MNTEKLIPFDLEKAKAGYSIVTRDGTPVTEWHVFPSLPEPIVYSKGIHLSACRENGKFYATKDDDRDLFLLPKETSVYRNVYKEWMAKEGFDSIEACYTVKGHNPICIIKITTTENGHSTAKIVHHYNQTA